MVAPPTIVLLFGYEEFMILILIEISPVLRDYNNCYIMLLNSPQALENTGFVAGELSLIVSLVLYRPTSVYEL